MKTPMNNKNQFQVKEEDGALRLDLYLVQMLPSLSRSQILKFIQAEAVSVNDVKQLKAAFPLKEDDRVVLDTSLIDDVQIEAASQKKHHEEIQVIHEDENYFIVQKPVGLLVHPGDTTPTGVYTLVDWIYENKVLDEESLDLEKKLTTHRPGIVHRLDRDTSGLMIVARNQMAQKYFNKIISKREVTRLYWVLAQRTTQEIMSRLPVQLKNYLEGASAGLTFDGDKTLSLATYHAKNPKNPTRYYCPEQGERRAISHFKSIQKQSEFALLSCKLQTGRTHQIRVHMKLLNNVILGDTFYDGALCERLMLKAYYLSFVPPQGTEPVEFFAQPDSFEKVLEAHGFKTDKNFELWKS